MFYFVLVSVTLILFLIGYMIYTDYKDNITFRGEKFSESLLARKLINFFIPRPKRARKLDTRLFYLFEDVTVRDYVMFKLILSCCAVVLSVSIVATNYFANKEKVFTKFRNIPFTISEDDYYTLTQDIRFDKMDKLRDQNIILSNAQHSNNYQRFLTIDSLSLYDTLLDIKHDLSDIVGFRLFVEFMLLVVSIIYLPDLILWQLNRLLVKDMDFEFAKLESYIYANANKKVEVIIRGLTYESVIFRRYFIIFLSRYREDTERAFDLILNNAGIHPKFKQLVEYLLLLKNTDSDRVRSKILVNQENHFGIVRSSIVESTSSKKRICTFINFTALIAAILGIIIGVISSINIGGLM